MDPMGVKKDEQGNYVITLGFPVEHNGKLISEILLRGAATVEDLEEMDKADGTIRKTLHLVAGLSGQPIAALRKLRAADYAQVSKTVTEILGN